MPENTTAAPVQVVENAGSSNVRVLRFHRKDHKLARLQRKADPVAQPIYSRQEEETDPFVSIYTDNGLIPAPYAFVNLYKIFERSDVLQTTISAVVHNTTGFGYKLQFTGDDYTEKDSPTAKAEEQQLRSFFDQVNASESFTNMMSKVWYDYHVLGNAAIEVVRDSFKEVQMLYHVPARTARLSRQDEELTEYQMLIERKGKLVSVNSKRYFRKIAQVINTSVSQKGKKPPIIWYREYNDPRPMDRYTGSRSVVNNPASEILWIKRPFAGFVYGLPAWIGATLEVMGRTSAQFVNYDLLKNQGIPPMLVTVSNGILTDDSYDELEASIASWRGEDNFNRVMVLESVFEASGLDDKGTAKIDIKFLSEHRKEDSMFTQYLKGTEEAVRKSFRLPPLYTGGTEEYSRATALASMTVAEQQVFSPERRQIDEVVNLQLIRSAFNITQWKFTLSGPQIAGSEEITKGVQAFSEAGALSVNYAIELLNQAFGMNISKFPYKWADMPIFIIKQMLATGATLTGMDGVAEAIDGIEGAAVQALATQNPQNSKTPALPQGETVAQMTKAQPRLPIIESDDLFDEKERELYMKLLTIDSAIKERLAGAIITGDDYML